MIKPKEVPIGITTIIETNGIPAFFSIIRYRESLERGEFANIGIIAAPLLEYTPVVCGGSSPSGVNPDLKLTNFKFDFLFEIKDIGSRSAARIRNFLPGINNENLEGFKLELFSFGDSFKRIPFLTICGGELKLTNYAARRDNSNIFFSDVYYASLENMKRKDILDVLVKKYL